MNRVVMVLLGLIVAGCATHGSASIADRADDWPPMDYTQAQMITELGQPTTRAIAVADGKTTETLSWTYAHAEANPALFIPIVGLFVAASGDGMNGESRSLAATFQDGKMTGRAWSRHLIGRESTPARPASEYWAKDKPRSK